MSRFAVTWTLDGHPHAHELESTGGSEAILGREEGVEIVVPLATVSRRQARFAWDGSRFTLENLSTTNATRLDGGIVTAAKPVADGASIVAGDAALTFHDLATGDRIGGPRCSHCGRENASGDAECWFCGTSLVNALTGVRSRLRVMLRLVDIAGGRSDLLDGQSMRARFDADGWDVDTNVPETQPQAAILIADGRPTLQDGMGVGLEDPDGRGRAPGPISTGDVLVVGERRYVTIAR